MPARFGGAMRSVFWLLGLAALAVALALLVGHNNATLTLFWPPYRFDVSFNFVVFCLIAGFVLLYAALRAFSMLRDLPAQAQRWRSQQVERSVVGAVMDALSHQLAGRFVRAQAAAQQALDQLKGVPSGHWPKRDQLQLLAHLLLAESAQSLQNRERRDDNLQAALNPKLTRNAPEAHEGALLRAVRWAVEDRDANAARAAGRTPAGCGPTHPGVAPEVAGGTAGRRDRRGTGDGAPARQAPCVLARSLAQHRPGPGTGRAA